jgi:hypothetical protein
MGANELISCTTPTDFHDNIDMTTSLTDQTVVNRISVTDPHSGIGC